MKLQISTENCGEVIECKTAQEALEVIHNLVTNDVFELSITVKRTKMGISTHDFSQSTTS